VALVKRAMKSGVGIIRKPGFLGIDISIKAFNTNPVSTLKIIAKIINTQFVKDRRA